MFYLILAYSYLLPIPSQIDSKRVLTKIVINIVILITFKKVALESLNPRHQSSQLSNRRKFTLERKHVCIFRKIKVFPENAVQVSDIQVIAFIACVH